MEGILKDISGGVTAPKGFLAAGVEAHIKYPKRDLAMVYSQVPAEAAAVFTQNKVKAAPVLLDMDKLPGGFGKARAIVVNSGNANACNGPGGMEDAMRMAQLTAEKLNIDAKDVLVSSTGVIGFPLPMDKVEAGIEKAAAQLAIDGASAAAEAIMTTDTFPKELAVQLAIAGKTVTIGGMAKGSGMIHPNMATMLGFITTDVTMTAPLLHKALKQVVDRTFNMITVDGDTSTNDMVIILANGLAANETISAEDEQFQKFMHALEYLCQRLAKMIALDGEGATKLVEVAAVNAGTENDARLAVKSVANSNLVKTAIFGEDANWGRILTAVGYSGADFDPQKIDIYLESAAGREKMAEDGTGLAFDEERAAAILAQKEIKILIDFKVGYAAATAWTCDFSYDYVKINADYRT